MRDLKVRGEILPLKFLLRKRTLDIKFYEIDANYVSYLSAFEPLLFHNSRANQTNSRKFIGILWLKVKCWGMKKGKKLK